MNRNVLIVGSIVFLLGVAGAVNALVVEKPGGTKDTDGIVCAMDVRECTDGSYVSRQAPGCAFAACPDTTATTTGACTKEAKLCPDGSSTVGRTGPNCEFAACPSTSPVTLSAHMNEKVSGLGVSIVPIKVLEDSRCPADVQCIQAGTVRLQARLTSSTGEALQEFKLDQPVTTEAEIITLTAVSPAPKSTIQIKAGDYVFTFKIAKRTGTTILPYQSGIRGTVMLGPTCPVIQNPPNPECADKPYATSVSVRRANLTATFASVKSDSTGAFAFSLPPGDYVVSATGGNMLPRCPDTSVTVGPSAYQTITISCDTGIR